MEFHLAKKPKYMSAADSNEKRMIISNQYSYE